MYLIFFATNYTCQILLGYPNFEMIFKLADALAVRPEAILDAMESRLD